MPVEFEEIPSTKVDRVGRSGTHPLSGPVPSSNLPVSRDQEVLQRRQTGSAATSHRDSSVNTWLLGFGRGVFGGFFLYNGINHFVNTRMLTDVARAKHVPLPAIAVASTGAMLVFGSLSLLTGIRPKAGTSLISAFLLGVSPQIHNFWKLEDPQQRLQEMTQFMKNVALLGGACFAAAIPEPWPLSLPVGRPTR